MGGLRNAGTVAAGVVVLVALVAAIRLVRATAPSVDVPAIGVGSPDPDDPDLVTCERTLPDAPELQDDIAEVEAVGRVRSSEVIECPAAFDGQVVEYVGEVIGDVLQRTGGAWLLVNDDAYALENGPLSAGHGRFAGYNRGVSGCRSRCRTSNPDGPAGVARSSVSAVWCDAPILRTVAASPCVP